MNLPRMGAISTVLLTTLIAGCSTTTGGSTTEPASAELHVVATTTVLGDIGSTIAGNNAVVEALMPPGADPHDFQPSSQQVASLNDADLVIANGLGFEEGFIDILEGAEADGVAILEVGALIDPLPFGDSTGDCDPTLAPEDSEDGDEPENAPGSCDPHFWNDPTRAAAAAEVIADALSAIDPSIDWATPASAYADELSTLGDDIQALLDTIPETNRKLVTNHDALGYFAHRYGFEVVGVVIPGGSTLADPSSAELAALVAVMEEENVRVIFAETISPSVLADAVAAEIGGDVEVVELYTDSLGPPGSGAETLVDMLRLDAERIAAGLT